MFEVTIVNLCLRVHSWPQSLSRIPLYSPSGSLQGQVAASGLHMDVSVNPDLKPADCIARSVCSPISDTEMNWLFVRA